MFNDERVSLGSFQSGIFRPAQMRSPAALSLLTVAPKPGHAPPYEDGVDPDTGRFIYHFRAAATATPGATRQADRDNAALVAAHQLMEPLIYFKGIFPGQYAILAPVFIVAVDESRRLAELEVGLPVADTSPQGLVSDEDVRAYATRDAVYRLHQQRFRAAVLMAYGTRCAVCSLRERDLLDASHIIPDGESEGAATVTNGIALCTIHHRAYDRNLMGIDPDGQVHISRRLLEERDGPMLRGGLQAFHGAAILRPRRADEHPDPGRLHTRFEMFLQAA